MTILTVTPSDDDYPRKLRLHMKPPAKLYVSGAPLTALCRLPCIAIVGTRSVSSYGEQVAYDFARKLAEQGIVIVSGLAHGVDAIAHRATLEAGGLTIAVLPSPIEQPYPSDHSRLAAQILERGGALVSEYADGPTYKSRFVARNRIVTGLADAVLIVEATANSGTIHTAGFAHKQQRPVFCIPGPLTSRTSAFTNQLISNSQATAVTSPEMVLKALHVADRPKTVRHRVNLNSKEQTLIQLIKQGHDSFDDLVEMSSMDISTLNRLLAKLEQAHILRLLSGDRWMVV